MNDSKDTDMDYEQTIIEEGIGGTGKFLRMHADMEHDAENGVCIEYHNGRWIVAGVVVVDSIDRALELAA